MKKSDILIIFASIFGILWGIATFLTGHVKYPFYILYLMLFLITLPAISRKNMLVSTVGVLLSIPLAYLAFEEVKKLPASIFLLIAFELGIIGMYAKMVWKIRWKKAQYVDR